MASIAIVGGGRMGEALLGGFLATGHAQPADVVVVEPVAARRDELAERYRVRCAERAADVVGDVDTVVLAVKPQAIDAVARDIAESVSVGALVISIAAGVTTARLEALLPASVRVIRVMPNTPAMIGAGMSVVSGGSNVEAADVESARGLLETVGRAIVIPEELQDVATAVSGSGPAYVAVFAEALARAGVKHGLPYDTALELALQTLAGSARLMLETGKHPAKLADEVASPAGTTAAGLEALEAFGLRSAVAQAVDAATERSRELGG